MLFTYERIKQLNDLEFEVYNCVIKLGSSVLDMKIRQLADLAHVSTTVVLNFCKKMNCDGWTVFKIKYKESLQEKSLSYRLITEPILDYLQVHDKDKDKQKQIDNAVDLINKARRVIFIGAGPSGVMAKYGALYLSNLGKSTQYIDLPYYPIPMEDYDDVVVVALSISGETVSVIHRLMRFKELGAKLIAITNAKGNTMSRMVDLPIFYHVPLEEFHISEKIAQFHINLTTQMPVMHLIETISKKYHGRVMTAL